MSAFAIPCPLPDNRDLSRVRCDRNNGNDRNSLLPLGFIGAVMPKDSVGARSVVLRIGFEDLFAVRARKGGEFVCLKAWMMWVDFQVTDDLPNLLEDRGLCRRLFNRRVLPIRCEREFDLPSHAYFLACLANEPR
jgi:hypothetical protein